MSIFRHLTGKTVYITLFAILYIAVAFVSTFHAVAFFGLANDSPLAILLACTFEIGQAAVLFSILTSARNRTAFMPWVLMTILTLVQILGNVYSSYKYIITYSPENLRYFKEPVFIWTTIPDNMATVIITYIVGAILPVTALMLTSMVAHYIDDQTAPQQGIEPAINNSDDDNNSEAADPVISEPVISEPVISEPVIKNEQHIIADDAQGSSGPLESYKPLTLGGSEDPENANQESSRFINL